MKIAIDTDLQTLEYENNNKTTKIPLYSKQAFEVLSEQWLRVGWNEKYVYTFTWMGRPIIQLPEDVLRVQEAIYKIKPDVIIETGIAHGGSLILYASLCKAMGKGRVIGVDIEIRPHNRAAIEAHELFSYITLIEGSSTDPDTVKKVKKLVKPGENVLVILDSNHTKEHVLAELDAYQDIVTVGSYIVATDGSMEILYDVPRGRPEWAYDNPSSAAVDFARKHPEFALEKPAWGFNESLLDKNITHWTNAWLKRVKP